MDFVYLLRVLLKRKWIIIGSTVLAAIIAWFFMRNEKKEYRSVSQVSTGFTTNDVVKMGEENDFFQADTKFSNALVTFTSPTVISLLSYRVMLHDLQDPTHAFTALTDEQKQSGVYLAINKLAAIKLLNQKLDSMSILTSYKPEEKKMIEYLKLYGYDYNTIAQDLSVYRLEHTDYIQINYVSPNPELSAFLVNAVFQEFVRYYRFVRDERSSESIDTLKNLLDQKRALRAKANEAVASTGALDINNSSKSSFDLISDLQQKLDDENNNLTADKIKLQSVNSQLANIVTPAQVITDNSEVIQLKNQMNDAQAAYLNSGSSDQNLLNKYNNLKAQYQAKLKSAGSASATPSSTAGTDRAALLQKKSDLEDNIQAENAHIASLTTQINETKGNVNNLASRNATAQSLSKDADLSDEEYSDLLKKYNAAVDASNASVNNFNQILKGQPAIDPEPSKKYLIVGMAGSAVLVLSILIIIFLTYLDSSIKTPVIFSRVVNLKLLSMINFMNLKDKMLADVVANTAVSENAEENSRNNAFRESLRKLRYEIERSGKKVFLFTSTRKGQGKTTLIQALSYSFSLSRKKVLIIDTNFCNNDLTVQLHGTPVLEQIVADEINDKVIQDVTKAAVDVHGGAVYVIGCGGGDYTPSEILPAKNILLHLNKLTEVYDYVFLEGPPLNEFSDSRELSEYVDGVVAIFSAKHIIKQIDKDSIRFFKGLNGKFTGSVLNMVELENLNDA